MKIAHLLPYSAKFPLVKHNGRCQWVLRLATSQALAGHEVTIFAAPRSYIQNSRLAWQSLPYSRGDKQANNYALMKQAFSDTTFDIYHSHFDTLHYNLNGDTIKPIIVTQHWFPNNTIALASKSCSEPSNIFVVPPTNYMATINKELGIPCEKPIHHGIDLQLFRPLDITPNNRLIFVGRITPQKGVLETIQIALKYNQELDIVGKINDKDKKYWQSLLPFIDGKQIVYIGAKTQVETARLLSQAKAFIFTPQEPEAFGQVIIESQACGTPVITNNIGANAELLINNKTGYLALNNKDYSGAFAHINSIKRNECRSFAEQFSSTCMFTAYETLYINYYSAYLLALSTRK